ncbi:hypothetical protein [Sinorhizobium arboris]|uniref:hypothetical protein n=1 Tax=Sinorhizobium arboris TaxID=76745 RepID=UPI00124321F4|nr:hypothetical protein [Sinorhizobium arboris]
MTELLLPFEDLRIELPDYVKEDGSAASQLILAKEPCILPAEDPEERGQWHWTTHRMFQEASGVDFRTDWPTGSPIASKLLLAALRDAEPRR